MPRLAACSKEGAAATADAKKCSTRVPSKPTTKFTLPGLLALTSKSIAVSKHLAMCLAFEQLGIRWNTFCLWVQRRFINVM
jgi:glucose-6-phosphate isomerase